MSVDDRRLQESWRERAPSGGASCPDAEAIWRAVGLESSAEERRAVIEHVGSCASCAEAWRLAAGLADPKRKVASAARNPPRPVVRYALMAASVLLAGLIWVGLRHEPNREVVPRATPGVTISSRVADGATLPRGDFLLRWTPGPKGTIYDVQVGTTDLKLLSRAAALKESEYLVPKSAFAGVPPSTQIAWRVQATLPDGRVVSSVTYVNPVH